jgi:hypothetical protein
MADIAMPANGANFPRKILLWLKLIVALSKELKALLETLWI